MLDAKTWMYIPLNLKVEFENLSTAYEKLNVEKSLKKQYVFFLFKKKHEHLEHRASLFVLSLLTRDY